MEITSSRMGAEQLTRTRGAADCVGDRDPVTRFVDLLAPAHRAESEGLAHAGIPLADLAILLGAKPGAR
ncbi:hypothetical protein ACFU44_13445 [Nocardia rhizosphaerihabitans]|uniref:hypothetical protein n=1 Tax=Nocardia rhizosphaerihabitans TaxID=1691570 RepID=UPI00366F24BE